MAIHEEIHEDTHSDVGRQQRSRDDSTVCATPMISMIELFPRIFGETEAEGRRAM